MGHGTIKETFDRYGHLFPGNEAATAARLDAYLAERATGARVPKGVPDERTAT